MQNRITAQLPVEGLLFWKLNGREAISESFALTLTLLGTDARIDRSKLLGQPVTVTIPSQKLLTSRYINGKITRVAVSATELTGARYSVYQLTVEPDLWTMKRDRNLRIFQGQTVPQIVKKLLNEHQVNMEDRLTCSYRVWEYCVQYQESSLDFISRLMELEGIAYYFSHEADKHTLVLTDAESQHQQFSGYEVIPYHQTPSGGSTDEEGISQWALEDNVTPGIYSLDDYDFRKPNAWLFKAQQNPASPKPGSIDVFDWPGRFVETEHADFYARIRQERWQVEHQQIQATATAAGIAPGHIFTLTNAPFFSDNGEYLVTAAGYHFEENRYASGQGETIHRTDFTVIPASVSYRPEQSTAWPRTYGPQTAKVVGPDGESIWTDKYGRVKVQFHWDRLAKGDDTSSCWVRVSSAWAGQGYGGVQIPRLGDEVVVDFINGDPDRPIITGRLYNEGSMPPWTLPEDATRMGFMTRSKEGNKDNASFLFFEDKRGSESVQLHSEKDMQVSVENDKTEIIHGNLSTTVNKIKQESVTGAVTINYEDTWNQTVTNAVTNIFNGGENTTIQKGRKLNITSGGDTLSIKGERTTEVIGDEMHYVNGKLKETVDGGLERRIKGDVLINVDSGNWTQNVNAGAITLTSPETITLKSSTKVKIDAPQSTSTIAGHKETITGSIASITGASMEIKGISLSEVPVTISHNVISLSRKEFEARNAPLAVQEIGTLISKGAVHLTICALKLFF